MPTYNIIGDIHGRTNWKELVEKDCINVFVGDYFDPYTWTPFFELQQNFQEIIDLKKQLPDKVVLLYGNHDYGYLPGISEESSRYDALNAPKIAKLLTENESLFHGVAYAIGERYIVTHAGISKPWVRRYLPEAIDYLPSKMAEAINTLWLNDKPAFGFRKNADLGDFYGESIDHSPIWVRPISLGYGNIYKRTDVIQIVGHSKVKTITEDNKAIFIDCLESVTKSKRVTIQ
jgi:hypothetical protein